YEIIVSNPPYIPSGEISTLMEEVKDHDPLLALDGREDGLYFYREIIKKAGQYLHPGGMLFLEIGCSQAEDVCRYMKEADYKEVAVCKDLAGLDRVVSGVYGG
ncbi:MAG: peptide chain release factor N(5)-glutamine methyltransferase, partial [Lachnospiraceae bacterium]|nr:peptide chain release factor N(5)-glutamine methyltransferase [Lachnospiraceae bacterium]